MDFALKVSSNQMALIRNIFWLAIFVGATFAFTVLFEYGPTNFVPNAKKEYEVLKAMVGVKAPRAKDNSDKLPPTTK
jgi:hypothetical protein